MNLKCSPIRSGSRVSGFVYRIFEQVEQKRVSFVEENLWNLRVD